MRRDREVPLSPIREAPIAISYKCRNWWPGSSIPAGGDGFLSPAFPASFPPLSRNFYGPIEKSRYGLTAKHRLRSPINAGIGGREVQFRLEGTKFTSYSLPDYCQENAATLQKLFQALRGKTGIDRHPEETRWGRCPGPRRRFTPLPRRSLYRP